MPEGAIDHQWQISRRMRAQKHEDGPLSAAVAKYQDRLYGDETSIGKGETIEGINTSLKDVSMSTSVSESQLRFNESMLTAAGPKKGKGKGGPEVKKGHKA